MRKKILKSVMVGLFWLLVLAVYGSIWGLMAVWLDGEPFYVGFFLSILGTVVFATGIAVIGLTIKGLIMLWEWIDDF